MKANGVRDIAAYLDQNPDLVEHAKDVVRVTDVNRDAVSLFRADNAADLIKPVRYIFAAAPGLAERVMVAHFEGGGISSRKPKFSPSMAPLSMFCSRSHIRCRPSNWIRPSSPCRTSANG